MSNVMVTLSAIASGLASIVAVTGYSLAASGIAFVGAPPAFENSAQPGRDALVRDAESSRRFAFGAWGCVQRKRR